MTISSTGDGLNILIACDYLPHHSWMSFLCWYSLTKNLPEAKIAVASHRRLMKLNLFGWTRKCNVPFILHKATDDEGQVQAALDHGIEKPILVVPAEAMCVRDFTEAGFSPDALTEVTRLNNEMVCDCKEERPCVFATYPNGWGKFVTSSWINKGSCPFLFGVKYGQGNLTANEARIGRLWNAATPLFQTVSRG
jgi:hypothetical protein